MSTELSFHHDRQSPLHRRAPLTNVTVAASLAVSGFLLPWPWAPYALFLGAALPLAALGRVMRPFLMALAVLYLPFAGFLFLVHGLFHPSSEDELLRLWIFSVQGHALLYAAGVAGRVLLMVSSSILLFLVTHPGRLMQDLQQRGMHWALAYVVLSTLQVLPLVRARAQGILQAQRARGLDTTGSLPRRARALLPLLGPLFHGVLLDVEDRAMALETRLFTGKGSRTYLRPISDHPSDRIIRRLTLAGLAALAGARAWAWFACAT